MELWATGLDAGRQRIRSQAYLDSSETLRAQKLFAFFGNVVEPPLEQLYDYTPGLTSLRELERGNSRFGRARGSSGGRNAFRFGVAGSSSGWFAGSLGGCRFRSRLTVVNQRA